MTGKADPTVSAAASAGFSRLAASDGYVPQLDGMRAIAVACVVSAHYRLIPFTPGGFGVTLFFFLSGYLITTLFYAELKLTSTLNIGQFYLRRWLRLTPPLIVSCAVGIAFYPITRVAVGGHPVPVGTALAALFYYTNYYDLFWGMDPGKVIPFGICWSLAVEEHFYLLWPWMLRRIIRQPNRLAVIVAAFCVVVLAWRVVLHAYVGVSEDYTGMATDSRIDSILYGALLRILLECTWATRVFAVLRARKTMIVSVGALLLTFVVRGDWFRETIRYSVQGIALMPVFAMIVAAPASAASRALASKPMVLIGRLSYSIYLFHLLARTPGEVLFGSPFQPGPRLIGLILTFAIAYLLFIGVERPMARLRHRFRAHAQDTRAAPQAGPGFAGNSVQPE
jgi:peptidoglycan/LPS O-acetylase OafA/YrhL